MNKEKVLKDLGYGKHPAIISFEDINVVPLSPELDDRMVWRVYNRKNDILGRVLRIQNGIETELCSFNFNDSASQISINGQTEKDRMSLAEITNMWRKSLALDGVEEMSFEF